MVALDAGIEDGNCLASTVVAGVPCCLDLARSDVPPRVVLGPAPRCLRRGCRDRPGKGKRDVFHHGRNFGRVAKLLERLRRRVERDQRNDVEGLEVRDARAFEVLDQSRRRRLDPFSLSDSASWRKASLGCDLRSKRHDHRDGSVVFGDLLKVVPRLIGRGLGCWYRRHLRRVRGRRLRRKCRLGQPARSGWRCDRLSRLGCRPGRLCSAVSAHDHHDHDNCCRDDE